MVIFNDMFYRQKFDTFIRIYDGSVGYFVNKSNNSDRVTEESGAVFLAALSREPKTLNALSDEIAEKFMDVEKDTLKNDIVEFYGILEEDGFIVSGETKEELDRKDKRFSYSALEPKTIKTDFTPKVSRAKKSSQKYLEKYFKDRPHLMSLQIELTSRCNERCVHCYIPHENKVSDIEPALFYDILKQCRDMGVLSLTLSGGEPMLHKDFCDFLLKAKEYDFSINVLSNLTLLNDEIIAEMKANRLSSVQVSLYSLNPEIHDNITKLNGSFYKTRDNILRLIENDIPVQISCPTMKQNRNCFSDVMQWAHEHKCRATTDYIMMGRYDHTADNLDNRLSLDEVGKIINEVISQDKNYQQAILADNFDVRESRDRSDDLVCGVCVASICMVANGNVYPCAGWQGYVCGNVRETALREIWNNSPEVKYLRGLRKKDFPKCRNCEDKGFCAMCMVRNANENPDGDPLRVNEHFCKAAALNRKIVLESITAPMTTGFTIFPFEQLGNFCQCKT
ncbi:MAG: PqqD family peptide modification chaperone, partial [Clostridiales bacterium]|nr:PqqD family peptide modification chaperone [Clostridiales bacterium]